MGNYLVFILESSICLILFYLFYKILLSKETFYRLNRFILLGIIVFSMLLPFCKVKNNAESELPFFMNTANHSELNLNPVSMPVSLPFPWEEVITKVYLSGCVIVLFVFIYAFLQMMFLLRSGKKVRKNDLRLILTDRPVSSFSWMNYVVIPLKDWEEHGKEILRHEKAHINSGHSWDLLFMQICIVLFWFNPVVWLIRQELQAQHEFEADDYVIRRGMDRKEYQLLLIKKAVGNQRFVFVSNRFSHSKLKRRIQMMQKKRSISRSYWKYIFILPLSVVAITLLARPEVTRKLDKISKIRMTGNTPENDLVIVGWGMNPINNSGDTLSIIGSINKNSGDDPLIIVNGKEITNEEWNRINPETIESITVLKDASAVKKYGEKSMNGVIEVKTKADSQQPIFIDSETIRIQKDKKGISVFTTQED